MSDSTSVSGAITLHCRACLAVSGPILQEVPYPITGRASTSFCKKESPYCKCAMLHCTEEFVCVFAVDDFPYCIGARLHCSSVRDGSRNKLGFTGWTGNVVNEEQNGMKDEGSGFEPIAISVEGR
jgi:hypothetical protein